MFDGFFLMHRALLDKPVWKNSTPEQKCILVVLIEMANFADKDWEWKGKKFSVKRGQFITSLASIVDRCGKGVSTQNIRSALTRFEKLHFLTNESTKTGRLVTICNYNTYQDMGKFLNIGANKEVTKTQQRGNKEVTPKKESKELKKEKKPKRKIVSHGEFSNVKLTDDELLKLKTSYGETQTLAKIEQISIYIEQKGDKYKSHYATAIAWFTKEGVEKLGGSSAVVVETEFAKIIKEVTEGRMSKDELKTIVNEMISDSPKVGRELADRLKQEESIVTLLGS